uniref:Uncharacterized protein n=1 Tax=Manihot esculenta TaxID=3983 RepID=A0A2C9VEY3_MANES
MLSMYYIFILIYKFGCCGESTVTCLNIIEVHSPNLISQL